LCNDACGLDIDALLQREIDVGSFPGASYAAGSSRGIDRIGALGNAVVVPVRIPATVDTIFDCASITKALVTTTIVLDLFPLDHRIHGYTVRELLTHTSGLRAWLPLYAFDDPLRAIVEQGPECDRGTRVIYSDLNFVLLWMAIADYDARAAQLGARLRPSLELRPRIAATEWGQRHEMKMCAERGIAFRNFRQELIWAETHDGNSHHLGNGCAGNAGLFATASEVFEMTRKIVNDERFADAITNQTEGIPGGDARGLGWQMGTGSAATEMLTPGNFGHTGFTGTSVWVDRDRDKIMVLLTNRVHPCAAPVAMQRIRGEFHRAALAG
jgi:CubicO group peptidase (beta-lactamase class C family)